VPEPTRVTVIGTGYLGATHAACLAELGYDVLGLDTDPAKIADLAAGLLPFSEPGLAELVERHTAAGRPRFTTDPVEAAAFADLHFVCVGTPQRRDSMAADTSHVEAAVAALVPHLRGDALLVGKSTVPVGTAAGLQALADRLAPAGVEVGVARNPEFLREGRAVEDTLRPDRIITGADLVLHLTEWPEFRDVDPATLEPARRVGVDGRNALDADRWAAAGWRVRALGRPAVGPAKVSP